MKIFRDLTGASNNTLMLSMQKLSLALFGTGMFTGFSIMMAGMSSKNHDFESTLLLIGIAIFFLLVSILLYTIVRIRVIPEVEKRLNAENKI